MQRFDTFDAAYLAHVHPNDTGLHPAMGRVYAMVKAGQIKFGYENGVEIAPRWLSRIEADMARFNTHLPTTMPDDDEEDEDEPEYTCPACGGHTFKLDVLQSVIVEFLPDDDHDVQDGPSGDMEWDNDSYAECNDCAHRGKLGNMQTITILQGAAHEPD
jgi:DNA-directed RNA polymerase subunit RPC12/RpoP